MKLLSILLSACYLLALTSSSYGQSVTNKNAFSLMAGTWEGTAEGFDANGKSEGKGPINLTARQITDGNKLVVEIKSEHKGTPMEFINILCYDNESGRFEDYQFRTSDVKHETATVEGFNQIGGKSEGTFTSYNAATMDGKLLIYKKEYKISTKELVISEFVKTAEAEKFRPVSTVSLKKK